MYQAKLLKLDDSIEEEVLLEINGLQFIGFTNISHYPHLVVNKIYHVNLDLTIFDDPELVILNEPQKGIEKLDKNYYGYILRGQVCGNCIDIGNGIKIQDDMFEEYTYLDTQYVKIKVDRIGVELL